MQISPQRAVALGTASAFLLLGMFVAGIIVREHSSGAPSGQGDLVLAKKIACRAWPGFRATDAARERVENCEIAADVQNLLISSGALAADVHVSRLRRAPNTYGPEYTMGVNARVFLPEPLRVTWDPNEATRSIALLVGTTLESVTITDDRHVNLDPVPSKPRPRVAP